MATGHGDIETTEPGERAPEENDQDAAPIIRLANTIIKQAIEERASDIHVEPDKKGVRVRYRIDGVLRETHTMPDYIKRPLVARFKVLCEMNIADTLSAHDGSTTFRYKNRSYPLRVSSIPTIHGEEIQCRILDPSVPHIGLGKIGMAESVRVALEELAALPDRLLLITGPTGAGKSTTQYSLINKLNSAERKVVTVEDPVEYEMSGITQIRLAPKKGLEVASVLRFILRHDPDVIMVGEIRDYETAQLVVEAALTGHQVLSTLHTADATSAIIRLLEIGIAPYLVAASLGGVLAQRLVRKICSNCKEAYEVPAESVPGFEVSSTAGTVQLWRGRGCENCRRTGYAGRTGIYSLLTMSDEIADLAKAGASLADLRRAAQAGGMKTLRDTGIDLVLQGRTTFEEVLRVTS